MVLIMIVLKCENPIRIKNKYTDEWMYVNCRHCSACQINKVNGKALNLQREVKKYPFAQMVTLTYENNSLPFMVMGSNRVYRGIFDPVFPSCIGILEDYDIRTFEQITPTGFPPEIGATGVLWYDDIKNFFKRLRINYERKTKCKFPWQYSYIGELGTIGKRPHFHILFFGRIDFDRTFRDCVIKSWTFHDWDRLDMAQIFKQALEGVASYVTSYVNCLSHCDGFFSTKRIKPKTARSKNIDYAVAPSLSETVQKSLKFGLPEYLQKKYGRPFEICDYSKLNNFSNILLPKRYLLALFQIPSGLCGSNFNDFRTFVITALTKRWSELDNSEYLTNLSFKKYRLCRNLDCSLSSMEDYVIDCWTARNYFNSLVLRESMMEYEQMTPKEYYLSRYQSNVDKPDLRNLRLAVRGISAIDGVNDAHSLDELSQYVDNYKFKLLPKHLKDILNGFNI